jgi:hypothetical protein
MTKCDNINGQCKRLGWCYCDESRAALPPVRSEPVVGQDELDALRKDKARLDWLETQACWIGVRGEYDISPDYAVGGGYSVTVRAACDSAMLAVSEQENK